VCRRTERDGRYRPGSRRVLAGTLAGAYQPDHVPDLAVAPDANIYEVQNNGNWYDFDFMLGVVMAFGGGAGGDTALAGRYRPPGPSLGGCVALMGLVDHLLVVWLSSTKITRCRPREQPDPDSPHIERRRHHLQ
jgi:hypothetical protein